jgi:hypothetical protein
MLYRDYEILVMQDYEKKKAGNALHSGLAEPTPAGIRDACRAIWLERYHKSDEKTLKEFFKYHGEASAWPRIIDEYPTGKFKALMKFLNKETDSTRRTNMELLAWLIDFRPRPFVFGLTITVRQAEENQVKGRDEKEQEATVQTSPETNSERLEWAGQEPIERQKRKIYYWIALWLFPIIVSAAVIYFWSSSNKSSKMMLTGYEKCMFWDEDRYQLISCQKHGDTLVTPFDSVLFMHFRKILQPDTISASSIGKLWYIRYRGQYEYYTADGAHPIDPQLRLRPLTRFILDRHIPASR